MESVLQNIVPQAGILNKEENPAIDSDRVKASVVDAGSTDFGGSQKHNVANQADAEEVTDWPLLHLRRRAKKKKTTRLAPRQCFSRVKNKGGVSGEFYIRQEELSYATEEHGKVHRQSTYGSRQVTAEP